MTADGTLAPPPGPGLGVEPDLDALERWRMRDGVTEPLVLTGFDLTASDVAGVARDGRPVELAPDAVERMASGGTVVLEAVRTNTPVYGLTTGVGAHKRGVDGRGAARALQPAPAPSHRVGQGPYAPAEVVRAALLRLVNGFASGTTGVRPSSPSSSWRR